MERNEKIVQMGEAAETYYKDGYCCSEAILKAVIDVFSLDMPPDIVRLASGFCGGMGNREGPCGVFSGGRMALGSLAGRTNNRDDDRFLRKISSLYSERVREEANGIVCRDILGRMGIVERLSKRGCRRLTRKGAEILAEIIIDNEIIEKSTYDIALKQEQT